MLRRHLCCRNETELDCKGYNENIVIVRAMCELDFSVEMFSVDGVLAWRVEGELFKIPRIKITAMNIDFIVLDIGCCGKILHDICESDSSRT